MMRQRGFKGLFPTFEFGRNLCSYFEVQIFKDFY